MHRGRVARASTAATKKTGRSKAAVPSSPTEKKPKGKWGGARPGAGRPRKDEIRIPGRNIADPVARKLKEESYLRQLEERARAQLQKALDHNQDQIKAYADLGELPEDPLAGADFSLRALQVSLREVLADTTLTAKERRAEVRQITRAMIPLLPVSRLHAAERLIREAAAAQDRKTADPELTPAPTSEPLQMD